MGSTGNEAAQAARLLTGSALQLRIAEMLLFPQLRLDHVVLAHSEAFGLGNLQKLLQIQGLLQKLRQMGLFACVGEESVELFERHRKA
jgi:hypothetical protein